MAAKATNPAEYHDGTSSGRGTAFVINAQSGPGGETGDVASVENGWRTRLEQAGFDGPVKLVSGKDVAGEVERFADAGFRCVVVGGGDGTVGTAAEIVSRRGLVLGVLPLGTRNHFARDLAMPLDLPAALEWLSRAVVERVDLGEVNGRLFINNASLGLYARMVRERKRGRARSRLLRNLASVVAVFRTLVHFRLLRLKIVVRGMTLWRLTPFLFVGNNAYSGELGLDPTRPSLSEGKLWVCAASAGGVGDLIKIAWRAWRNHLDRIEHLNTETMEELMVGIGQEQLWVAVDGELRRFEAPLRFRSRPLALKVLVGRGVEG